MSKARAKGTRFETELLDRLRLLWPTVDRAPLRGIHDQGDFLNVPILIEAKNTKAPHFLEWARGCHKKSPLRWLIAWHGDRRVDNFELAIMPLDYALWLIAHVEGTSDNYIHSLMRQVVMDSKNSCSTISPGGPNTSQTLSLEEQPKLPEELWSWP